MSWLPPSFAGVYDPQSRHAPRPSAAAPEFTFGHLEEKQQSKLAHASPVAGGVPTHDVSTRPEKASYDPPAERLRWWRQPRSAATVSGSCNRDVEAFWAAAAAEPGTVKELVNVEARLCNKAQGLGSSIAPSLGNRAEFDFAPGVQSLYKSDLCSTHKRVGKRGVVQPEAAMAAYEESRQQAERNKAVGQATNMKIALF